MLKKGCGLNKPHNNILENIPIVTILAQAPANVDDKFRDSLEVNLLKIIKDPEKLEATVVELKLAMYATLNNDPDVIRAIEVARTTWEPEP